MDAEGRSEESSEGIVADHAPFTGVTDAVANQDKLREDQKEPSEESHVSDPEVEDNRPRPDPDVYQRPEEVPAEAESDESADEEDRRPSARRRIKQVLYSDKSESSVDDMMEDTPSNYNIANGRLEGKSMGLKAILLFAKNQGVNLGKPGANQGQLPQIQEESQMTPNNALNRQSSGEGMGWRAMN